MSSDNDKVARFTQMLKDMKADYLVALPRKIELIQQLIADEKWADLNEEYHKLKGTGKTYGFPEVSEVCQALETLSAIRPVQNPEIFKNIPVQNVYLVLIPKLNLL